MPIQKKRPRTTTTSEPILDCKLEELTLDQTITTWRELHTFIRLKLPTAFQFIEITHVLLIGEMLMSGKQLEPGFTIYVACH